MLLSNSPHFCRHKYSRFPSEHGARFFLDVCLLIHAHDRLS